MSSGIAVVGNKSGFFGRSQLIYLISCRAVSIYTAGTAREDDNLDLQVGKKPPFALISTSKVAK